MNILAVDTAGKTLGVALMQDEHLLYECSLDAGHTHSETLMPLVDHCLHLCGMKCADIDLYAVNAGPGSFTGLRIGLAAVKGWPLPTTPPVRRFPRWKRWPAPTAARAPWSAPWMHAGRRCTALHLTWLPTSG